MHATVDFEIIHAAQTEPIDVRVRDTLTENLVDVQSGSFNLIDISDDTSQYSIVFGPDGSTPIIAHPGTGIYQYDFDSSIYEDEYLASFILTLENETTKQDVFVKSVSARHFAYAAQLRPMVDKARKSVSDEIVNIDRSSNEPSISFFYGYDSKHLIFYLERGLQYLNAIPPYTSLTLDTFPFAQYGAILVDAGIIACCESQQTLAIDSDFSYSLGGNSLIIDHFSKLSSFVQQVLNRFTKTAISWKQQYRSKGLVIYQFLPGGVRAMRQLNAMPSGWWSRLLSAVYQ